MAGGPSNKTARVNESRGNPRCGTEDKSTFVLIQVFLCAPGISKKTRASVEDQRCRYLRGSLYAFMFCSDALKTPPARRLRRASLHRSHSYAKQSIVEGLLCSWHT